MCLLIGGSGYHQLRNRLSCRELLKITKRTLGAWRGPELWRHGVYLRLAAKVQPWRSSIPASMRHILILKERSSISQSSTKMAGNFRPVVSLMHTIALNMVHT